MMPQADGTDLPEVPVDPFSCSIGTQKCFGINERKPGIRHLLQDLSVKPFTDPISDRDGKSDLILAMIDRIRKPFPQAFPQDPLGDTIMDLVIIGH